MNKGKLVNLNILVENRFSSVSGTKKDNQFSSHLNIEQNDEM
ncbi:hypothetical protein [Mesobacillus maritimus]